MATLVPVSTTVLLTTAFQTVYSSQAQLLLTVSVIRVANTTAAPVAVTVCMVKAGDSPSISNAALWLFSLPANDFMEFGQGDIIVGTETIQAKASSNAAITIRVSGTQQ